MRAPSSTLVNLGVHYQLPRTAGFDHRVSLNVNNVFDRDFLKVNRQLGERRAFYLTYTLGYAGGR
ncbi:MAG: TonB-dependent receptor [Opitutaceae bacterium]|nr:TonB-dependent receptor [Opitutaceae bacterium]